MILQFIQGKKVLNKALPVLFVAVFTFLAVCDHFEDIENVVFQDIEIITDQDFDDFDFPAKISRTVESALISIERYEQTKIVDFLFSIFIPLRISKNEYFVGPPQIQIVYQFFACTSIFRNAP